MSQETREALSTRFWVGFTQERGNAWHWRAGDNNHWDYEIPVQAVKTGLFGFDFEEQPLSAPAGPVSGWKALVASDTQEVVTVARNSYAVHQYREWLVDHVETLLDDQLRIAGAGLPRNRAQAYVQVELPETVKTAEGEAFRPFLLATTSIDGSLATEYSTGATRVVCDNTLSAFLRERSRMSHRVKHTRHSTLRKAEAMEAIGLIYQETEQFQADIARLCSETVTDRQWDKVLDIFHPVPTEEGNKRTRAINRRDELVELYNSDPRVAPWRSTAWGVLMAFNTHAHHVATIKGASRVERNATRTIDGTFAKVDNRTLSAVAEVLDKDLVSA